jgi:hypothetical protein
MAGFAHTCYHQSSFAGQYYIDSFDKAVAESVGGGFQRFFFQRQGFFAYVQYISVTHQVSPNKLSVVPYRSAGATF